MPAARPRCCLRSYSCIYICTFVNIRGCFFFFVQSFADKDGLFLVMTAMSCVVPDVVGCKLGVMRRTRRPRHRRDDYRIGHISFATSKAGHDASSSGSG